MVRSLRKGYTLMEMMVVVGVMGIVVLAAPKLFTGVYRFTQLAVARAEIQKNSRGAISNINRGLRQAKAGSIVVDQLSGMPPHSRMTFLRYKPDGSTETISYYQSGKKLYLSSGGAGGKKVADNLRYISFTYPKTDNAYILSISLTFEKATYEGGSKALQMAVEKVRIMN